MSTHRGPVWINPDGYTCRPIGYKRTVLLRRKVLYAATLIECGPLTFLSGDKQLYRMGKELTHRDMITDLGSIPVGMRKVWPEAQYERSYLFHDYGCIHGGFWWFDQVESVWLWVEMTRKDRDKLLREMIYADQVLYGKDPRKRLQRLDRAAIYRGVRIGSRWQGKTDSSGVEAW